MACTLINPNKQLNIGVDVDWSVLQTFGAGIRIPDSADDHYVTIDVTVDQAANRALGIPLMAGAGDIVVTNPTNDQTIGGNVIISGNLTVSGTTTTLDVATLTVDDPIIRLNEGNVAADGGLEIDDDAEANPQLIWDDSETEWVAGRVGSLSPILLESGLGSVTQAWGAVLDDFNTLGAASADGQFIVATGSGVFAYESGNTARASMGTIAHSHVNITSSPYTVLNANYGRLHLTSSTAATVNLPAGSTGMIFGFKRDGSGSITIDGDSAETINGSTTYTLSNNHDVVWIYWNGTEWKVWGEIDTTAAPSALTDLTDTDITSPAGGNLLRYDGTDSWNDTAFTIPDTIGINEMWYASAANVVGVIAAANNSVLVSNGSGVPSMATTLPSGLTILAPVLDLPQINDTSDDHQYIFAVSELTADRTVTLPLLTGNDTFVFESHSQTLSNKTLTTPTIADFTNATHDHQDAQVARSFRVVQLLATT